MLKQRMNPLKLLLAVFLLLINFSVQAAITLSIETNPDPVAPDEAVRTAITVGNTSTSVSDTIILQLKFPEHLNRLFIERISGAGTCNHSNVCDPGDLLIWTLGNLAPGKSITVTLPPIVTNNTPDATQITFDAEVFEDNSTVVSASRNVIVQSDPAFDIAVDENLNPVAPGEPLTYTITYANRSTVSTTDTQLRFPLPAGVSFVSASNGGALNGNIVEWDLHTFFAKKGGHQTVTVSINPGITSGTQLEVDAASITGQVNFIEQSARAVAITRVENNIPLALEIELNPNPVQQSESIQSSITVGNMSGDTIFGATLQLRYPEHLNRLTIGLVSDGGTCNHSNICDPGDLLIWTLGNLAPGSSVTVTLPPIVKNNTPDGSLITFDAEVFEDNGTLTTTSRTVVVQSNSVFDITVDEDLNPVAPGEPLTYTVTYANRSAVSTKNTLLSFPLPAGVSLISASNGWTLNGNTVEWNLHTLAAQKSGRQTVTVNVDPGTVQGTLLEMDATSITGQVNFIEQSAHAVAITRVENNIPLALKIELNPNPVQQGELIQSSITVGNMGSNTIFGATLQLRYPEHLNRLSIGVVSDGGTCNHSNICDPGDLLIWTLGNLAPGHSVTVSLPPIVTNNTPDGTLITFDAKVFEDNGTLTTTSRSVVVESGPIFDIAVDENLNPVAPGEPLTYTVTYANRSTVSTTNTLLSFPLPLGVSFVSASNGGSLNGDVVKWDLQTFPAKKGGRQTVTVNVDPGIVLGALLEMDAASITGQANLLDHSARAVAITRVENNIPLALKVELAPNPVQKGESILSRITVDNISGEILFGVTLQLRSPKHLDRLSIELISDAGTCNHSNICDPGDLLIWTLGNLAPGGSITVSLPPIVRNATPDGSLISFVANVKEDNGRLAIASRTALVSDFDFIPAPVQVNDLVPNVVGITQAAAEILITNAGLNIGTITTSNSDTVPVGNVISQTPVSGSFVALGSTVNLVISEASAVLLQTAFIERLYLNILGRASDDEGLTFWLGFIQTSSATQVGFNFFNSNEFQALQLNNTDFIKIIYKTILDREADLPGLEFWVGHLEAGNLREFVLYGFFQSSEFANLTQQSAVTGYSAADHSLFLIKDFVRRFYVNILGRQPELEGFAFWSRVLNDNSVSASNIAQAFFFSKEFINQDHDNSSFVEIAYLTLLDRTPDQGGKDFWVSQLESGLSRPKLVNSFIDSPEFRRIADEFGIRFF